MFPVGIAAVVLVITGEASASNSCSVPQVTRPAPTQPELVEYAAVVVSTVAIGLARLALAVVFLLAAYAKATDQPGTRLGVIELASQRWNWVSPILPVAEAVLAIGLLVPTTAKFAAMFAIGLLGAFTVLLIRAVRREHPPLCHCFGQLGKAQPVSAQTIARNVALIALAVIAALPS